eukprot:m.557463 g.557463  ORF g.557463 m.557463 type:complete len:177 (-) comp22189_c3_seq1:176-706(-)
MASSRAADRIRRSKVVDYYKILEITPRATQQEVKSAYYKQSLQYHPDHNPNDAAAKRKYEAVTEAYAVLGQPHLRNRYDRSVTGITQTVVRDPRMRNQPGRNVRSAFTGESTHYNFNEWYQQHHGEARKREQVRRKNIEKIRKEQEEIADSESGLWVLASGPLIGLLIYYLSHNQW